MPASQEINFRDIGDFLEDRARSLGEDAPLFYSDLAAHFGLPPITDAWFTHPLSGMFEQLDQEDEQLARPFRTALVISKERSIPGEGFFKALVRIRGLRPPPRTEHDKMRLYLSELSNLLKHYGHSNK
jgi:hypothetical protein